MIVLAQSRYFQDDAFVGYLRYLQYWKRPEYAKFIVYVNFSATDGVNEPRSYPNSLYFLDLLQNEHFRAALANPTNTDLIFREQFYHWQFYRANRLQLSTSRLGVRNAESGQTP